MLRSRVWRLTISVLILAGGAASAAAQTQLEVLHRFGGGNPPYDPRAGLIEGTDGNFYGTTWVGGPGGNGTVFRITPSGEVTILHAFGPTDRGLPSARLLQASDGNFYGTTADSIFRVQADGTFTVLGAGGPIKSPAGSSSLVQAGDGNLYGVGVTTAVTEQTRLAIFRLTLTGQVSIVYQCAYACDGITHGFTVGADGALYGTTTGSDTGGGTAFRVTTAGVFQTLHDFFRTSGLSQPSALSLGSDGNFYGTTYWGRDSNPGTIFRMTPAGSVTVLYSFTQTPHPSLGVIQARDGDLYGVLTDSDDCGGIFRYTTAGAYSVVHTFPAGDDDCTLGGPIALLQGSDGAVYGTTLQVGAANRGSVFRMTLDGTLTTLHSFLHEAEGEFPDTAPMQAFDGLFYGTTRSGGIYDKGVVYVMTADGGVALLHAFAGRPTDGAYPHGALIQASDGNLYGTTSGGGAFACGTIFRLTPAGVFDVRHHFTCGAGGSSPRAGVIQGRDGFLYGTTSTGGSSDYGTVFRMTIGGDFAILHAFAGGQVDGRWPSAPLVQAANGDFYGTTDRGGASGFGIVFRITATGATTVVQSFPDRDFGDGFTAVPGLIEGTDRKLYGNYFACCQSMAFSVAGMAYSIFYAFPPFEGSNGGFLQASDGNFYGWSGNRVYQLTDGGLFTVLHTLDGMTEGGGAIGEFVQGRDLRLYGVTQFGSSATSMPSSRGGTIVRLTLPFLQPNVALRVSINGRPSQTTLTEVPAGASTAWTASVTGGRSPFQYQFWISSDVGWRVVQDYSSDPTLRWTPSAAGSYAVQVWVRDAGSQSSWDAFAASGKFSVGPPPAVVVTSLFATPNVPRATGDSAVWMAAAAGGVGPLQYQFWISEPGTAWRILKAWDSVNQVAWTPRVAGPYNVQVWVRSANSTASFEAWRGTGTFNVAHRELRAALTADQGSPVAPGSTVTWTASASGGDGTPLEFRFWLYSEASATWTLARDYNASASWSWTPAAGDVGSYAIQVWARRQGSSASWEAWAGTTSPFQVANVPLGVVLVSNQGTPPLVPAGTTITWRAIVTGAPGPMEYRFWRYNPASGTWTMMRDYGAGDTYVWRPATQDVGISIWQVWVRAAGSGEAYEGWSSTGPFLIQP